MIQDGCEHEGAIRNGEPFAPMDASPVDISIVIVTWNCRALIDQCLWHVAASRHSYSHEVIVVDNQSSDGTADHIAARWPEVKLIRSGGNLGFARGNNLGFTIARGRLVLLLNPDCYLTDPETLHKTVSEMDRHPEIGACGVRLTYPDGRYQVGDAGFRPTPASIVSHAFTLSKLFPAWTGVFLTREPPKVDGVCRVDWITGAFMMVRASVIERVGGLDGNIFMYGEDVEWGCRMRDSGVNLAYFPQIAAVHLQGGTQADPDRPPSTKWLDGLIGVYDRFFPNYRMVPRVAFFLGFGLRALAYGLAGLFTGRRSIRLKARAMAIFACHALTC